MYTRINVILQIAPPCYKQRQGPGGTYKNPPHLWEMRLAKDGQESHQPTKIKMNKVRSGSREIEIEIDRDSTLDLVDVSVRRCLITSNGNNQARTIRQLKNWLNLAAELDGMAHVRNIYDFIHVNCVETKEITLSQTWVLQTTQHVYCLSMPQLIFHLH